jgi:hypothetical protein
MNTGTLDKRGKIKARQEAAPAGPCNQQATQALHCIKLAETLDIPVFLCLYFEEPVFRHSRWTLNYLMTNAQ